MSTKPQSNPQLVLCFLVVAAGCGRTGLEVPADIDSTADAGQAREDAGDPGGRAADRPGTGGQGGSAGDAAEQPRNPMLVLSPASVDFGLVEVGRMSATRRLTVRNIGAGTTGFPTVNGAALGEFVVTRNVCTAALPAGAACDIDIALVPRSAGPKVGALEIGASPGGRVSASLSGSGLPSARPDAGGPPADRLANFLGTWTYVSGRVTVKCDDGTNDSNDLAGEQVTLERGDSSDLKAVEDGCTVRFDVVGTRATARPGQTCIVPGGSTTATAVLESWTFSTSDGRRAEETFLWTLKLVSGRMTISCTAMGTGQLAR